MNVNSETAPPMRYRYPRKKTTKKKDIISQMVSIDISKVWFIFVILRHPLLHTFFHILLLED